MTNKLKRYSFAYSFPCIVELRAIFLFTHMRCCTQPLRAERDHCIIDLHWLELEWDPRSISGGTIMGDATAPKSFTKGTIRKYGVFKGRIQVWADRPHTPPPFWQLNYANSAYFRAISANFDTRPPLFANPGSGPVFSLKQIKLTKLIKLAFLSSLTRKCMLYKGF